MEMTKKQHGGRRPGSGRPRTNTKQLNIRLSADALAKLDNLANEECATKAQVVERLILTN